MSGQSDLTYFTMWLFSEFRRIFAGINSWNSIIGYAILFVPVVRMVFRLIHKIIHVGNVS